MLHQDTAFLQNVDTRRFYVLIVCDGCYLHCGDDWVIIQSHVHFVGQWYITTLNARIDKWYFLYHIKTLKRRITLRSKLF